MEDCVIEQIGIKDLQIVRIAVLQSYCVFDSCRVGIDDFDRRQECVKEDLNACVIDSLFDQNLPD